MGWIDWPATRDTRETGFVGDVEARLWNGHPYRAPSDRTNWVHEGTHGVNSKIRNSQTEFDMLTMAGSVRRHVPELHESEVFTPEAMAAYSQNLKYAVSTRIGTRNNGFYFGYGIAFTAPEPNARLSDVARLIPQKYRDSLYNLYLVQQQRYWNDSPLYVFDEVAAYTNGTVYCWTEERSNAIRWRHSFLNWCKFILYAACLVREFGTEDTRNLYRNCYSHARAWERIIDEPQPALDDAQKEYQVDQFKAGAGELMQRIGKEFAVATKRLGEW